MFELITLAMVAVMAIMLFRNDKAKTLSMVVFCFMFSTVAFAQDLPVEALPPEWLGAILVWLKSVPQVGPVLVQILMWISVLTTVLTVLSATAQVLLGIPEVVARWSGAHDLADKIKKFSDKVLPWLKYISAFNVQKK